MAEDRERKPMDLAVDMTYHVNQIIAACEKAGASVDWTLTLINGGMELHILATSPEEAAQYAPTDQALEMLRDQLTDALGRFGIERPATQEEVDNAARAVQARNNGNFTYSVGIVNEEPGQ